MRHRRLRAGESQVARAGRVGISPGYMSQIEHGMVPEAAILERFAEALGDDPADWLAAANYDQPGAPPEAPSAVSDSAGAYAPRPSDASLPVAGVLRAAAMVDAQEESGEIFPCLQEHAALADYVVRVEGYSMFPALQPGDYIAVSKSGGPEIGDIVVARRGDETVVKRVAERRGRRLVLRSDNPDYPALEGEDITILGVVVWQHRPAEAIRRARG